LDKPLFVNSQPAPSAKPLRILLLVNLRWDERLGAVRVYMNLANEWRAAGHVVEHYSLSDAFPGMSDSAAGFALRQLWFASRARSFVRKNAGRFDIIDSLIGSLPASKQELRFNGLLVARSVGLYRLYERFEETARRRWPRRSRGKFLGRIFYTFTQRGLRRASDSALHNADLVTVPNQEEASCLRREIDPALSIIVQPYGISDEQRRALVAAAGPAEKRLSHGKISFIGMWAARKGAYDWPAIMRAVWRKIPDARFRFLGTMVEPQTIVADLGFQSSERIELVSKYSPVDLPMLLADCAVGAFPSYVEGFGLAVLEQLAAGIPTVAFEVAGPRHILSAHLPELLVPSGDVEAFANAICRILELDLPDYEKLSRRSAEAAAVFNWSKIARDTIDAYRERLSGRAQPILFVQPFSLGLGGGGGGRILRALLGNAPIPWQSVCVSPQRPKAWPGETHLPSRPSWGKIETSRLAMFPKMTTSIFAGRFRRRLRAFCRRTNVRAIHTVPHSGLDFAHAHAIARELSLPFFISVHDDLAYTAAHEGSREVHEPAMCRAWLDADARFVISDALGREYSRRYGERFYEVVTDGLSKLNSARQNSRSGRLRIYFMGLFHLGYESNFRVLLEALRIFERRNPGITTTVTCRCEYIRPHVWKDIKHVNVLPFANEAQIERDMEEADFLYMPMPFGQEHENFTRYSVSTKMVTYVGSGLPILYHGPTTSAAFDLLRRHEAAIFLTSLGPEEIARSLAELSNAQRETVVRNALDLARREFMLADQTRKFWGTICDCLRSR
jgi:glycosyltransferase involved in cell wall biosynthesis